ncbi:hypothetical protein [Polyangium jinanense]|uniref:Tetratricopeptide repeat protein n=1 Tax=Polyangium jinanense TaxID=2829994 RepID=A0A9X3X7E6_9BACT|nr:hypothetical protein [Polyangium jinanense]MDC3961644.1 hypothetical protein [Polyangium jinanense]MDC3983743.1 hypothetical protein [Polyangium jinanense]
MNPKRWSSRVILGVSLLVTGAAGAEDTPAPAPAPKAEGAAAADPAADAEAFLKTWNESGKPLCEKNEPGCAAAGQALVKAAAAFEAAHKRDKAIAVRKMILDPKNRLDYTDYGKEAAFLVATNLQSIGEFAEAANYHEAAARKFPQMAQAPAALAEAVMLRSGLKDQKAAALDVELFAKNYGAKQPEESARLAVVMADFLVGEEKWLDARGWLQKWMAAVDKGGGLQDRIHAHTLLGRSMAKLDDKKGAAKEFEVVRAAWKNPEASLKELAAQGGSDQDQARRVGRAVTDVGEALFFFAEEKRVEADAIRYPEYKGPADRESVMKHINTKVVDWVKKKRPAIEEVEKAYGQVVTLNPAPPPKWVIASASRVGMLWGKFVAEFRAAPIPKEWRGNGTIPGTTLTYEELRKAYYEKLDEASEPQKLQAKKAFEVCVNYSAKYQYFDQYARNCSVWLAKNYPKEHVLVEELVPRHAGASSVLQPSPVAKAAPSR